MSDARSTAILIIDDTPFAARIGDALRAAPYEAPGAEPGSAVAFCPLGVT